MVNVKLYAYSSKNDNYRKFFDENVYQIEIEKGEIVIYWTGEDDDFSIIGMADHPTNPIRMKVSKCNG